MPQFVRWRWLPRPPVEFPETESTLVIGGGSREGLWVDEFAVWSRGLSERELAALRLRPGGAAKRP